MKKDQSNVNKLKVLHVFNEIKFSGAELMFASAAELMQNSKLDLLALSTGVTVGDFSVEFEKRNIKVYHQPLPNDKINPVFIFVYFFNIFRLLKKEKIDLIHIHRSTFSWFFAFVSFLAKKPSVRTVHNVFKNRKLTWLKGFLERWTSRVFFNLTYQTIGESVFDNELKYYKNPSIRINNWFDEKKFYPAQNLEERNQLRKQLDIPTESFVVISVGGCSSVKNHHDIINAISFLKDQMPIYYLHLGTGKTEAEELALSSHLNILQYIRFVGNTNRVRDYLIVSDLYIMTSRFEGLSISAIEAMACALPSILYNVAGLRDLINNNEEGFLIEPDWNELASKILFLFNNPKLLESKGKMAYKNVIDNFSLNVSVNKILQLYQKKLLDA